MAFAVMLNAAILNVPVAEPAGTDAARGTASPGSVLLNAMNAPPEGAAPESVTVQVLLVFELSVEGLHCNDVMPVTPVRLILTLCEAPP